MNLIKTLDSPVLTSLIECVDLSACGRDELGAVCWGFKDE